MSRIEIGLWQLEVRGKKCVEALRRNGFHAEYLPHQEDVRERVLMACDAAETIGFGGSGSMAEMGIYDALSGSGKKLFDHSRSPAEGKTAARLGQLTCDLFLAGTNAVTFGPKKIIVVAGGQKVVADVPEAIRRIKSVSAPRNAHRLHLNTPCASSGFCENCDSPQRICRVYSIIERKPPNSDITVFVCGEPMGL